MALPPGCSQGLSPCRSQLAACMMSFWDWFGGSLWRSPSRAGVLPRDETHVVVLKGDGAPCELLCAGNAGRVQLCGLTPWGELYHQGQPLHWMVRTFQRCLAPAWSSPKCLLFPPLETKGFSVSLGPLWQHPAHTPSFTVCPTAIPVQLWSQRRSALVPALPGVV